MVTELRTELQQIDGEIAEALVQNAAISGGLVKSLLAVRLEILRTSRAVVNQRILAEEGGALKTVLIPASKPDAQIAASLAEEIKAQQLELEISRAEVRRYAGGLVQALKMSTAATQEQSLSMLRQRYLVAKYGLGLPSVGIAGIHRHDADDTVLLPEAPAAVRPIILAVRLLKKTFTEQEYQEYVFFDVEFIASGLKRSARAIKGQLKVNDLFGETKMTITWTLDIPFSPGSKVVERGKGFKYNQFMQPHQWVNSTPLENMTATFDVNSILYQDGSRDDL